MEKKKELTRYQFKKSGPCFLLEDSKTQHNHYVQSAAVQTCPKCGHYLQTIPISLFDSTLTGYIGRWRCISCGFIPDFNIYDKKGMINDQRLELKIHCKRK